MVEFHETIMGKRYYELQFPSLIKALQDISTALQKDKEKEQAELKKEIIEIFSESNAHE